MDYDTWAEEEVPPPLTDDDAPLDEPGEEIYPWELTDVERRVYEAGFMVGYASRDAEVAQLNHEADRLYDKAFNHPGRIRR
ncbi:hypothetical protein [Frigoribacterium sp. CFBP 13707]|uniref:hypothetical protein n=1 Tax=Frigoribacterium sp. CFBP 13707 TaxID=2775313 RepID=UPI00177B7789|nr:hypothetical protein [Frigoribacterium sp. CFBP 13707]MBD8729036.1 hypothetical protein [Frigoribacterium sp. CFBP 13707]